MKLLKTALLGTIVFGLISCDVLDSPAPQQSLDTGEVLSSADGIEGMVTGMYDGLQSNAIANGQYNYTAELLGDNIVWTGSFPTFQDIAQRNLQANNGNFGGWWNVSFREINTANILLQEVDQIDDPAYTEDERDIVKGEAYFARGMLYLQLANVFAKPHWDDPSALAVPIRTEPVLGVPDFENLERRPLSEVFNQAQQDLQQAANLLPDTRLRANRRATRYAALTYLMRLELMRQDYPAADGHAQAIEAVGFSLTDLPVEPFQNEFSAESIFEIINTNQDNGGANGGVNSFYTPAAFGGRGDIQISQPYVDALGEIVTDDQQTAIDAAGFTVVDLRAEVGVLLDGLVPGSSATLKYPDGTSNGDNVMNSRYAEVLLTRAETITEVQQAVTQEAIDYLNEIRVRSLRVRDANGNPAPAGESFIEYIIADFANAQELIDAIILERRVELAFEGDRFYTLKRRALPVINSAGTFQTNDPCMVFPIPQGEIDANPNMVPNPQC